MEQESSEKKSLRFLIARVITILFKNSLTLVNDLRDDHEQMLNKIEKFLPEEDRGKLDLVDYFDDEKFTYLRKKILDEGNNTIRELERALDNYEIQFKREK